MIVWAQSFLTTFHHLFLTVLPYFILGILAGAYLESAANFNVITRFLGQGKRSILWGSLLGAILPGCACATMPMAEGLVRKGARLGTVTAFMMTSPLLAPQTVILTLSLLGPSFTIARVGFGLIGGIGMGLIVHALESKQWLAYPESSAGASSASCCHTSPATVPFWTSVLSMTKKLGGYLILGIAIASALTVSVPPDTIPNTIGQYPHIAYIIAAFVGIPIYICEGEEIPITFSLITLGLAAGPAFTFLLGAVGTCIPTLLFAKQIIGKKPMLIYAVYWAIFAPLAGMIFSIVTTGHL